MFLLMVAVSDYIPLITTICTLSIPSTEIPREFWIVRDIRMQAVCTALIMHKTDNLSVTHLNMSRCIAHAVAFHPLRLSLICANARIPPTWPALQYTRLRP